MKKILALLMLSFTLCVTSCVTPVTVTQPEQISYYDDYFYMGVTYPVVYLNSTPYYYCNERWVIVPQVHYRYIRHYHNPMHFSGVMPYDWRGKTHGYYNVHNHNKHRHDNIYHRYSNGQVQHNQPYSRPQTQRPQTPRPQTHGVTPRSNGYTPNRQQHTTNNRTFNNSNQRPMSRGGYTTQRGTTTRGGRK